MALLPYSPPPFGLPSSRPLCKVSSERSSGQPCIFPIPECATEYDAMPCIGPRHRMRKQCLFHDGFFWGFFSRSFSISQTGERTSFQLEESEKVWPRENSIHPMYHLVHPNPGHKIVVILTLKLLMSHRCSRRPNVYSDWPSRDA